MFFEVSKRLLICFKSVGFWDSCCAQVPKYIFIFQYKCIALNYSINNIISNFQVVIMWCVTGNRRSSFPELGLISQFRRYSVGAYQLVYFLDRLSSSAFRVQRSAVASWRGQCFFTTLGTNVETTFSSNC